MTDRAAEHLDPAPHGGGDVAPGDDGGAEGGVRGAVNGTLVSSSQGARGGGAGFALR